MQKSALLFTFLILLLFPTLTIGQESNLNSLIGLPLDEAQTQLQNMGYEIAHSSLFAKDQLWWNEAKNDCVKIKFSKKEGHKIESVEPGDEATCISGAEASRKVWESYHDGQAEASSDKINAARDNLKKEGYVVSYWILDAAPGRSTEYWWNESAGKCMHIVWNTNDKGDVKVMSCDADSGKNPAPDKK